MAYTGLSQDQQLNFDDEGKILSLSGMGAHVQWDTGSYSGEVTLVDVRDLVPLTAKGRRLDDDLDDSLEVVGLGRVAARQIYEYSGSEGLLDAMVESGHLSIFSAIAEEAVELVSGRIRTSPDFLAVTAHLDEREADEMVRMASVAIIQDALNSG